MADTRAAIYLPPGPEGDRWIPACLAYVERQGYRLTSVVRDWDTVQKLLDTRAVDVLVVTLKNHPPADRIPRIEYVEDETTAAAPQQRRPQRVRQHDEG